MADSITKNLGKIPPHAVDVEEAILGSCLVHKDAIETVHFLHPKNFYKQAHEDIFSAIKALHKERLEINLLSVVNMLKAHRNLGTSGGAYYVSKLTKNYVSGKALEELGRVLMEKYMRRELIHIANRATASSYDDADDVFEILGSVEESMSRIRSYTSFGNINREISLLEEPDDDRYLMQLAGKHVLFRQEMMSLVAKAGIGKSQICEAVCAGWVSPNCDSLGFTFKNPTKKLLFVDTERSKNDCIVGLRRVRRRVGENPEFYHKGFFKTVKLITLKEVADRGERKRLLGEELDTGDYSMLILDGAGDFIYDPNDARESNTFIDWLIAKATANNCGILNTIHDNPATTMQSTGKARGHLGSELIRRSQCVVMIKQDLDPDSETRTITTNFGSGKNRNDSDRFEHHFTWSDKRQMFMSTEVKVSDREIRISVMNVLHDQKLATDLVAKMAAKDSLVPKGKVIPLIEDMVRDGEIQEQGGLLSYHGYIAPKDRVIDEPTNITEADSELPF